MADTTLKSVPHLGQRWSMGVLSRISKMHTDSIIKLIIGYGWKKGRTDGRMSGWMSGWMEGQSSEVMNQTLYRQLDASKSR